MVGWIEKKKTATVGLAALPLSGFECRLCIVFRCSAANARAGGTWKTKRTRMGASDGGSQGSLAMRRRVTPSPPPHALSGRARPLGRLHACVRHQRHGWAAVARRAARSGGRGDSTRSKRGRGGLARPPPPSLVDGLPCVPNACVHVCVMEASSWDADAAAPWGGREGGGGGFWRRFGRAARPSPSDRALVSLAHQFRHQLRPRGQAGHQHAGRAGGRRERARR